MTTFHAKAMIDRRYLFATVTCAAGAASDAARWARRRRWLVFARCVSRPFPLFAQLMAVCRAFSPLLAPHSFAFNAYPASFGSGDRNRIRRLPSATGRSDVGAARLRNNSQSLPKSSLDSITFLSVLKFSTRFESGRFLFWIKFTTISLVQMNGTTI